MDLDEDMSYIELEKNNHYRDSTDTIQADSSGKSQPKNSITQRITRSPVYVGGNVCCLLLNLLFLFVSVNKLFTLRKYCPDIPYSKLVHQLKLRSALMGTDSRHQRLWSICLITNDYR